MELGEKQVDVLLQMGGGREGRRDGMKIHAFLCCDAVLCHLPARHLFLPQVQARRRSPSAPYLAVTPGVDEGSAGQGQGCGRAGGLLWWLGPLLLLLPLLLPLVVLLVLLLLPLLVVLLPPESRRGHDAMALAQTCGCGKTTSSPVEARPSGCLPPVCVCVVLLLSVKLEWDK